MGDRWIDREKYGRRRKEEAHVFCARHCPCLWFDNKPKTLPSYRRLQELEDRKDHSLRKGRREIHGRPAGSVMTVAFELDGHKVTVLNGGPLFKFNEAISFQVHCETQQEVDYYWEKLSAGGDDKAQQCGWLKDRYGVSWQIVPVALIDMVGDAESAKSQRAMKAMLQMKKIDIAALKRAYEG
jgi:predicted 3-demethylubiquinone-9 3-methyltransferase (glyoxalase superfamily)